MIIIVISAIIFVTMLLFPIVFSLIFIRKKGGKMLEIKQSKIKDPRYFVKSFTDLFEKQLENYDGSGKIKLSQEESIIEADRVSQYPEYCFSVVYAQEHNFHPPAGIQFLKEIYACKNACLLGIEMVRAICCKKDLILGSGTHVIRWVDAEGTLNIYDDCDLGISASSLAKIVMGNNCRFRRLYAPAIFLGYGAEDNLTLDDYTQRVELDYNTPKVIRNIKYVDDDMTDDTSTLDSSIITKHDIIVLDHLTVKGHIRSSKGIRLCDGSVVYGNLFAEGDIYLGQNVRVYGSVFTQENLFAESGVTVGQYGKIKSIVARGIITFEKGCRVYGYISSESGGECCPDFNKEEELPNDIGQEHLDVFAAEIEHSPSIPRVCNNVMVPTVNMFEKMAPCGFRKIERITDVVIPEGVTYIPPSYFYECRQLRSIVLPSTIEEIGAFAFCGCTNLAEIDLNNCINLRSIGEAAFEGCAALCEVNIPALCRQIATSAFSGCGMEYVVFKTPSYLSELNSHLFKDCTALKKIEIPNTVKAIGMSAFYGCSAIKEIVIPESVERIGSYAFCGCTDLLYLRIFSKSLQADKHMLKGLPSSAKIWLKHPAIIEEIKGKEQ
ncbi:MAG: leucine-rich repeat protein [Christensenellales bacterium]|jgi:predicted acyltransferase (DUF342 family)